MNILFLTQVLPYPLTGGAKIRAYYVLRHLSQRHAITLVSFVRPDDDEAAIEHLASFCEAVHVAPMSRSRLKNLSALIESMASGRPAVIIRDRLPDMESLLSRLTTEKRFDVIHADQTSMAQYALLARDLAAQVGMGRPGTVLDQHNALYLLVSRQASYESWVTRPMWRREAKALEAYEHGLCRGFDQVVTVTEEDKRALLTLFSEDEATQLAEKVTPIPICIDASQQTLLKRQGKGKLIIHLGTMFWPPNIEGVLWFAEEVLPLIWQEAPEAQFVVAGKRPPQEVQDLSRRVTAEGGGIMVTGFVEDPRPYLEKSQVFIVPVRAGGGMRVKIVDGWLWGLPIVSTSIGAEGLKVQDGENIIIADEPAAFAKAVVKLLREPETAENMRQAGRRWVERHYDYREVYTLFDEVYETVAQ